MWNRGISNIFFCLNIHTAVSNSYSDYSSVPRGFPHDYPVPFNQTGCVHQSQRQCKADQTHISADSLKGTGKNDFPLWGPEMLQELIDFIWMLQASHPSAIGICFPGMDGGAQAEIPCK